jgi:hypothetical protein
MRNLNIVPANNDFCVHVALVDDGAAFVVVTKVIAWKVNNCEAGGDNETESLPITVAYGSRITQDFDFIVDGNFSIFDKDGELIDLSASSLLCAIQRVCGILSVTGKVWRTGDDGLSWLEFDRVICASASVDIACSR